MPISPVDLYERLKVCLGPNESKALIDYVDGKFKREVPTREDLFIAKSDLERQIHDAQENMANRIQDLQKEMKNDIWKLRFLIIVVLIFQIGLNPRVVEFLGKILGIAK